ncbi:fibrinogen-like protein A [Anopheles darlingi]|uniref:fibrinogen-like protein A n=1 Tax=Anopheles darlingi TaxID=43151 RepID=UPI0020FFF753|nr:fibrinogen-like protein A [Anopheles darlingi]
MGSKLELLLIKLEAMGSRLQKIEDNIEENRSSHEQGQQEMFVAIEKLEHQVARNLSELHKDIDNVHNITRQIMNVLPQLQQLTQILQNQFCVTPTEKSVSTTTEVSEPLTITTTTTTTTPKPKQPPFSSCKDVPLNVSGTYLLRVKNDSEPFNVYCEQEKFGGGWIVFQYRFEGSLDFYRGWNEFRDGFGDLNREFWLGLEKVHQITNGRKHELIVELKDFSGNYKYARYDAFEIGSESDQYVVKDFGNYTGTAVDNMSHYKGRKFSTKDRDNDETSIHCAQYFAGAWWHWNWSCTYANLNGRYIKASGAKLMQWYSFNSNYHRLSYSRMMIRELE